VTALRIAMIGAGGIAARHLGVLERLPYVQIVAHLSRRRESAERQAARYGGEAYDDVATLLDRAHPDAAFVTVPPGSHGAYEHALIERGVPFLVEKPLSADEDTAEEIGARLASSGLLAAVGYHWRAMDTIPELRATLAQATPRLVVGAWHSSTPAPAWWRVREQSGGQLVEQATHLVDLARHLLGDATVLAASESAAVAPAPGANVPVATTTTVRYDSGPLGSFTTTCALDASRTVQLEIACEGLHIRIDQSAVTYDAAAERRVVHSRADPFQVEDEAFLAAVRSGDRSGVLCDYQDALGTHRLVHEAARVAGAAS